MKVNIFHNTFFLFKHPLFYCMPESTKFWNTILWHHLLLPVCSVPIYVILSGPVWSSIIISLPLLDYSGCRVGSRHR